MRKILFLMMIALSSVFGFGQLQLLSEGFEGTTFPPAGWTTYVGTNGVGTAQNWSRATLSPYSAPGYAFVRYENITPDALAEDWMVTPAVDLTGQTNSKLTFYARQAYSANYGSMYYVKVSTTSQTDHASFTTVASWDETAMNSTYSVYEMKTVDLSAYDGQTIYVAFVMTNDDGDSWYVDNVAVTADLPPGYCDMDTFPMTETFEAGSGTRVCWENEYVEGTSNWTYRTGAGGGGAVTTAHGGTMNASFYQAAYNDNVTKLVSPKLVFTNYENATVNFWYANEEWDPDQDELRVYYKTSEAGAWTLIPGAEYTTSVNVWTEVTLNLPESDGVDAYYIAFEGYNGYGRGIVLDDITFDADALPVGGSGNTCDDSKLVSSLPYDDAGNTADYGDDYNSADVPALAPGAVTTGTGAHDYITGDDVVYSYTPTEDQLINVSTTNDDDWIGLWAFTGCPFTSTVGYHTATSGTTRTIQGLPVTAGETYYFVISTWPAPQSTEYTIHIEAVVGCDGTPEGGTATVDPTSGPSGAVANFTVSGYSTEVGVTYDWEYAVNGGDWESTGATADDVNFTITGDQGDEFTVRYAVTCTISGETAYSNEVTYTIDNTNCIPTFTNNTDYIDSFQLEAINNSGSGFSVDGYGDFTTMSTDLEAGMAYTASLTSSSGSGNHAAAAWIDFNDDTIFDVSERVGTADGIGASATADLNITIPADAAIGEHTLRVVYQYGTTLVGEDIEPCTSAAYGEGEDYTVNIMGDEPQEGCLDAENGQYPSATFEPTCSGAPETITALAWTGEYSLVQVTAGTEYHFLSSVNTDFVTIGNEDGTEVLAAGTTPVVWTADADQIIRFYLHFDSDCNWAASGLRSRIVQCGDILPPPSNDDCANAIELACGDTDSGNTTFATDSGGNAAGDVFYTFTGTGEEQLVTVSLCGSSYDTTVRIFSDCTLSNEIEMNDDSDSCTSGDGLQSEVQFVSDGSSTYVIMVEGYNANVGDYEIAVSCGEVPPPPSACEDYVVLSNNLENGLFFGGDTAQHLAVDLQIGDDGFTLYGMEPTFVGESSPAVSFIFYEDAGGLPGAEMDTREGTITNSVATGDNFGYTFYKNTIEFDSPIELAANTTYWVEVISDAPGWESTSASILGYDDVFYNTNVGEGVWTPTGGDEFVFNLLCDGGTGGACETEYTGTMQDGLGDTQALIIANDFPVTANTTMHIDQFTVNIFGNITTGDVYIYQDAGGVPGTELDSAIGLTPTSETLIGNAFGFNVYQYVFDFSAIDATAGDTETLFWVGLMTTMGTEASPNYWEKADANTNNDAVVSSDGGVTWTVNSFGQDGAFTISGMCEMMGVSDMNSYNFAYYPNPVKDVLNIESGKTIENVSVYNLAGQSVMNNLKVTNGQVNMSGLTPGVYVFRVMLQGGEVETFKIVKK